MTPPLKKSLIVVTGALALALGGALMAQSPLIQRTAIVTADVLFPGYEAVVVRVEIAPGGAVAWHTHPGNEITQVLEGETELFMAGKPNRVVKAGEGFVIPAGTVHSAKNSSGAPSKLAIVYVVEKGKPVATPAAAPK